METEICSHDGSAGETRSIDAIGHDWETANTTATETTDGVVGRVCKNDPAHREGTVTYAFGTAGLAFEEIGSPATAYRVRKGTVTAGTVHIPAMHRPDADSLYLPVTEIGATYDYVEDSAFGNTAITIPASVTTVGMFVFSGWTSAQTVSVPWTSGNVPSGWDVNWNTQCNAAIVYQQ